MHAHELGEAAFYSRRRNPAQSFFARFHSRTAGSGVREGLAETFQNFPTVQTLDVLRIRILRNQLRSFVLAGRLGC
jgi:hypothetical protein